MTRHFLRDDDLSPAQQAEVLELALKLKASPYDERPLAGPRTVAVLFDKPTLRTQASFASGIAELGGFPMIIDGTLAQVGVRESIADTARVLGRQASAIVWRTHEQHRLEEMAAFAGVPVVNALTDLFHPCQALADLLTVREHRGTLAGQTLTFVGDPACNMGHSLLLAGATAGMHVRVSGPDDYRPDATVLARAQEIAEDTGGSAVFVADAIEAAAGADVLATDTWISMGREAEAEARAEVFAPVAAQRRPAGARGRRRDRAALPARLPRQGDHRRGARGGAQRGVGRGREPSPRAEGRAGLAARRR